jgi:mono/diheme cytochrome c family protein
MKYILSLLAIPTALLALGCPKPAGTAPAVSTADGQAVYDKQGCANCHGARAPKLDHIGSEHDAAWIAAYVKDPKSKDPGSKMPGFAGKITDADLAALGAFLAAKK